MKFHTAFFTVVLLTISSTAVSSKITRVRQLNKAQNRAFECRRMPVLICSFRPTLGNTVEGNVSFVPEFRKIRGFSRTCFVRITANIRNLSPGLHGFHIHEYGDVRSSDGSATADHFLNPSGTPILHGFPKDLKRHWGDFGNLVAGRSGVARYSRLDTVITIPGIVGRGMILHALPDQGPSEQPTGASGARQAQCVIGFANPNI